MDWSPSSAHLTFSKNRCTTVVMTNTFNPDIGMTTRWRKGQPSPNPGGRPRTRLLSEALRSMLGKVNPDDPKGRTNAEIIAATLIKIASSENRSTVAAGAEICDRLEGRARQRLEVADVTAELRAKSTEELQFYLANKRWPSEDELLTLEAKQ